MEQRIHIKLISHRIDISEAMMRSLFETMVGEYSEQTEDVMFGGEVPSVNEDTITVETEGVLRTDGGRVEVAYDETELTGMEGAKTTVSFDPSAPQLVTMMRGGTVSTALVFEPHRRHICVYQTPLMPFEICVLARQVDNRLMSEGVLELDYAVEIRGAQAERTHFRMEIRVLDGADPLPRPEVMY